MQHIVAVFSSQQSYKCRDMIRRQRIAKVFLRGLKLILKFGGNGLTAQHSGHVGGLHFNEHFIIGIVSMHHVSLHQAYKNLLFCCNSDYVTHKIWMFLCYYILYPQQNKIKLPNFLPEKRTALLSFVKTNWLLCIGAENGYG